MTKPDLRIPPKRPSADYIAQLTALAAWHHEWMQRKLTDVVPFSPRTAGSDYNQHHIDIDADDDMFHRRAREIMGLADSSGTGETVQVPSSHLVQAVVQERHAHGNLVRHLPGLHDQKDHGRPGSIKKAAAALKGRIEAVLRGELDGDPFDGYSREQLRKVAKARGLDVPRGATREAIGDMLLRDVRGSRPAQPSAATRELVREVAGEMPVDALDWDFSGTYPRDSRGGTLPPPRLRSRLRRIMEAGKALHSDIRAAIETDPQIADLRKRSDDESRRAYTVLYGERVEALAEARRLWVESKRREQDIVRSILDQVRPLGGATHSDVVAIGPRGREWLETRGQRVQPAPKDWKQRVAAAERMLPTDWLTTSDQAPLDVVGTSRAFHYAGSERAVSRGGTTLALDTRSSDETFTYRGAFESRHHEVTLHELGHRMEEKIPGLKALEFAYVRSRTTHDDGRGNVEVESTVGLREVGGGGYEATEMTYKDEFPHPYVGKSYEYGGQFDSDPAARNWEAFEVGLQDVFGRGSLVYGDETLQHFVLGVLATLHSKEKS